MDKENHMKICEIFNEVLNDLEGEYRGGNLEYGTRNLVKGRGITVKEKDHLHEYRARLNNLLRSIL